MVGIHLFSRSGQENHLAHGWSHGPGVLQHSVAQSGFSSSLRKRREGRRSRQSQHALWLSFLTVGRCTFQSAFTDRKRNVQRAEEPRLPVRAQLWPWPPEPVSGARDVDDARLSHRPDAAALLSAVCGRLGEVHQQAGLVGAHARDLPPIRSSVHASNL